MKNNFTKEEYRKLLDIVYAGIMIINGNREPEDYLKEYEKVEQYIYSFAKEFGIEKLVDYDSKYKKYFTTPEFDEGKIEDLITEYNDMTFWGMLSFNLARRDVHRELDGKKADRETIIKGILEKEARYSDEFYENGLDNLELNKLKPKLTKDKETIPENKDNKGRVVQLKITLKNLRPPFWRRVLVKEDTSFYQLNRIIQTAMGWSGYHLYEFNIMGDRIGEKLEVDFWEDDGIIDSEEKNLKDYNFAQKDKFSYIYDFGDYWEHEILVEGLLEMEDEKVYPICIKGKRNCPPEDVGGPWGYKDFLDAINDSNNINNEEMLEWAGGSFDSEEFDINKINELLKHIE